VTVADLVGQKLPDLELPSSRGGVRNVAQCPGLWVFFIYPYTGRPGHADPQGWDFIAGAHGSTSQAIAYRDLYVKFQETGISLCGISNLSPEWQLEFSQRTALPYELLSDQDGQFASALQLQTFTAGSARFLTRRTLVSDNGLIVHDRREVDPPQHDAAAVLSWIAGRHQ
jgi:peroxiredoxin